MARPKPTGWKARATWHGLSSPCRGGRRRAEGWPTEHTEHTEGFLTGGNGVIGGRRTDGAECASVVNKFRVLGCCGFKAEGSTVAKPRRIHCPKAVGRCGRAAGNSAKTGRGPAVLNTRSCCG